MRLGVVVREVVAQKKETQDRETESGTRRRRAMRGRKNKSIVAKIEGEGLC